MLKDNYGRSINYLRISIIDRCNLRCKYCMPPTGVQLFNHDKIMRYEELTLIIKAAAQLGVNSIRLTGGEPLVRKGLIPFIKVVSSISGIEDIAITTNGVLLGEMIEDLKRAGVNRLNISLDTLDKSKYKEITGSNSLVKVLQSIEKSLDLGLNPVKINVVLMKNFNFNEVLDFVELTKHKGIHVRFIEMMPLGENQGNYKDNYVSWKEAFDAIKDSYEVTQCPGPLGQGPAKYYSLPNSKGTFGFITAISDHFCLHCNRLRITSDGFLKTCLFGRNEVNLKELCKKGDIEQVKSALTTAIMDKPQRHDLRGDRNTSRFMSQIGG